MRPDDGEGSEHNDRERAPARRGHAARRKDAREAGTRRPSAASSASVDDRGRPAAAGEFLLGLREQRQLGIEAENAPTRSPRPASERAHPTRLSGRLIVTIAPTITNESVMMMSGTLLSQRVGGLVGGVQLEQHDEDDESQRRAAR